MSSRQKSAEWIQRIVSALALASAVWLAVVLSSGCAQFHSQQIETALDGTKRQTDIKVYTLFDGKSDLTKLRATTTDKSQSTSLAGLDQTTSSTNLVEILRLIAALAAASAK